MSDASVANEERSGAIVEENSGSDETVVSTSSKTATNKSSLKKKSTSLPPETVEYLKKWMMSPEHIAHPYPTEQEKAQIMAETGIELKQLTNWFVNNRKRYWKPRVEARLREQAQASSSTASSTTPNTTVAPVLTTALIQPSGTSNPALTLNEAAAAAASSTSVSGTSCAVQQAVVAGSTDAATSSLNPLSGVSSIAASTKDAMCALNITSGLTIGGTQFAPAVSDQGSVSTETGSVSSSSPDVDELSTSPSSNTEDDLQIGATTMITRTESVDISILRQVSGQAIPSVDDVTILSPPSPERLLSSFENCTLTYQVPSNGHGSEKIRDSEIVRLKQRYLKHYLDESCPSARSSPELVTVTPTKRRHDEVVCITHDLTTTKSTTTRCASTPESVEIFAPRLKYRRVSVDLWKDACMTASNSWDSDLPSLEEATQLFGFASC